MEPTREARDEQMERQLTQWTARLETIRTRAEGPGGETEGELPAALAALTALELAGRHLAGAAAAAGARATEMPGLAGEWARVTREFDALWARVQ